MNKSKSNQGGYYAIKGYKYQFDKALLELLKADDPDQQIYLEQIQDINSDGCVIQVKYMETQKFFPSKIKKPIIQLLEEFKLVGPLSDSTRRYYLYCHFLDKQEGIENINLDALNKMLGKKKDSFDESIKKIFLDNFILVFSPTFQKQFENVISEIQELIPCSEDEAVFYYSNFIGYLEKVVISEQIGDKRCCTKKEITEHIDGGKKLIFNAAFREYKGEEEFFKFVKSKFVKARRNQDNFIFIGDVAIDTSVSIGQLVSNITDQHYNRATYDIKPLSFVVQDKKADEIKKHLIAENISFNDGYESIQFGEKLFFNDPVINKETSGNGRATENLEKTSFNLRIISQSTYEKIQNPKAPQMVYYFDRESLDKFSSGPFLNINKLNTKQISDLFVSQ